MLLKKGACLAVRHSELTETLIPGESVPTKMFLLYGYIFLDTNGDKEPNQLRTDQFNIPLDDYSINDSELTYLNNCQGIADYYFGGSHFIDQECTIPFDRIKMCNSCKEGYKITNSYLYVYWKQPSGICQRYSKSINTCEPE